MIIEIPAGSIRTYVWSGKAIRINRRYGARVIRGKASLFNSREYSGFIEDMSVQFRIQNHNKYQGKTFTGNVSVLVSFSLGRKKGKKAADVDAYNKQILDALEHAGVYENDNQVVFQGTLNLGVVVGSPVDVFQVTVMKMEGDLSFWS